MAIKLQGQRAIAEGVTDPKHTAVDKSLVAARGPAWHKRDRQAGKVPRGVDVQSTWGDSEYHGWVQGYSFEVVVSATSGTTVFPLLASVDVASAAEVKTTAPKIDELPPQVQSVSADSGYDANQTQLLAGLFVYQLLVRDNHRRGQKNGQLQAILDTL